MLCSRQYIKNTKMLNNYNYNNIIILNRTILTCNSTVIEDSDYTKTITTVGTTPAPTPNVAETMLTPDSLSIPIDPTALTNKLIDLINNSGSNISQPSSESISGPLDQFNVTALVGLKFDILGKFYLAITNISLYLALVLAVIIGIFYFGDNDSKLVPNK